MKLVLVSIGRYGPSLLIHTKMSTIGQGVTYLGRHKNMLDLKIVIFWRKIGENSKFRYKSSEYQNFTGFFAYKKESGNSNMFCKFQLHSMQIFFKMANKMSKN